MALDVGQAAVVLAGTVLSLTHGLIQCRIAGLVLGVHSNVIVPLAAIDGRHGQGDQEGIAGRSHVFGDAGFHNQIQALLQARSGSVAGGIRLGHSYAAVLHGGFQSVLDIGRIGGQGSGQFVVQSIAGVVVDSALSLVSIGGGQASGGQHGVGALGVVEAIQYAHLALAVHHLIVHGDVSNADISEFHTLNGVFAQLIHDGVVMQTGADVGFRIPYTVRAGLGDIVLVNGE